MRGIQNRINPVGWPPKSWLSLNGAIVNIIPEIMLLVVSFRYFLDNKNINSPESIKDNIIRQLYAIAFPNGENNRNNIEEGNPLGSYGLGQLGILNI